MPSQIVDGDLVAGLEGQFATTPDLGLSRGVGEVTTILKGGTPQSGNS